MSKRHKGLVAAAGLVILVVSGCAAASVEGEATRGAGEEVVVSEANPVKGGLGQLRVECEHNKDKRKYAICYQVAAGQAYVFSAPGKAVTPLPVKLRGYTDFQYEPSKKETAYNWRCNKCEKDKKRTLSAHKPGTYNDKGDRGSTAIDESTGWSTTARSEANSGWDTAGMLTYWVKDSDSVLDGATFTAHASLGKSTSSGDDGATGQWSCMSGTYLGCTAKTQKEEDGGKKKRWYTGFEYETSPLTVEVINGTDGALVRMVDGLPENLLWDPIAFDTFEYQDEKYNDGSLIPPRQPGPETTDPEGDPTVGPDQPTRLRMGGYRGVVGTTGYGARYVVRDSRTLNGAQVFINVSIDQDGHDVSTCDAVDADPNAGLDCAATRSPDTDWSSHRTIKFTIQ